MHITFSQEDIEKLVKKKIAGMGYSVKNIEITETGGYVAEVITVMDKVNEIMSTHKKERERLYGR